MSIAVHESAGEDLLDRDLNDLLRMETGWEEVGKGLTRILFGYGVWILGTVVGTMLVLSPLFALGSKLRLDRLAVGHMWAMYAGMGLSSMAGLMGNGLILTGQWKCAVAAPERGWTKWWMFICLVCLAMGPALSLGTTLGGGLQRGPELAKGAAGLHEVKYTTIGMVLQMTSFGMGILYVASFTLFLQAVAQCMSAKKHVLMVNLYLAFFVPLAFVTGYLCVRLTADPTQITQLLRPLMYVGIGWTVSVFFWLCMIAVIRSLIFKTVGMIKAPMDYSLAQARNTPRQRKWD